MTDWLTITLGVLFIAALILAHRAYYTGYANGYKAGYIHGTGRNALLRSLDHEKETP